MEETESLSSILSSTFSKGESAPAPKAEVAPAPPAEAPKVETVDATKTEPETKASTRDEAGRFTKAETKTDEPEARERSGLSVAIKEARERARRAEARLAEIQAKEAPAQKVSIFDNEDEGISQRVSEATRPLRETNFNMSVKLARLTYKDSYDAAEAAFFDSAEADQRLYQQLRNAADPGEFIMTVGTQIAELAPVGGDFVKYREKVTGELKGELSKRDEQIKLLNEQVEALKKSQVALESIPRSLNKGNESAPRSNAEADDDDIRSIVRFGTKSG
jgi:hypothetical protein